MAVLLLTGRPGVGKTTLLRRVAGARAAGGFLTEEIRERGRRVGFSIVPFGRPGRVMAHVDFGGPFVGRYGVDVAAIDAVAERTLRPGRDLYLVDEIGRMECLSETFLAGMRALLDAERVVATIALRGGGFIAEAKRRPDAELWEVTTGNRDRLVADVRAWISR